MLLPARSWDTLTVGSTAKQYVLGILNTGDSYYKQRFQPILQTADSWQMRLMSSGGPVSADELTDEIALDLLRTRAGHPAATMGEAAFIREQREKRQVLIMVAPADKGSLLSLLVGGAKEGIPEQVGGRVLYGRPTTAPGSILGELPKGADGIATLLALAKGQRYGSAPSQAPLEDLRAALTVVFQQEEASQSSQERRGPRGFADGLEEALKALAAPKDSSSSRESSSPTEGTSETAAKQRQIRQLQLMGGQDLAASMDGARSPQDPRGPRDSLPPEDQQQTPKGAECQGGGSVEEELDSDGPPLKKPAGEALGHPPVKKPAGDPTSLTHPPLGQPSSTPPTAARWSQAPLPTGHQGPQHALAQH